MYSCHKNKIVEGKESFSLLSIIIENILYLAIWCLAGALFWPVWMPADVPVLTIIWIIVVMDVQIMLKKHNCSGCYYYDKLCHLGWGKISSHIFAQDSGDIQKAKLYSLFYILSPVVTFIVSLVYGLIGNVGWWYWLIFGIFILLNIVVFPVRKCGCGHCKIRQSCFGSAAKCNVKKDSAY